MPRTGGKTSKRIVSYCLTFRVYPTLLLTISQTAQRWAFLCKISNNMGHLPVDNRISDRKDKDSNTYCCKRLNQENNIGGHPLGDSRIPVQLDTNPKIDSYRKLNRKRLLLLFPRFLTGNFVEDKAYLSIGQKPLSCLILQKLACLQDTLLILRKLLRQNSPVLSLLK